MQIKFLASLAIFLGSYLPLGLILLVQDIDYANYNPCCWEFWKAKCHVLPKLKEPYYSLPIFLVCLACFGLSVYSLLSVRAKNPVNVKEVKYVPAELMSYTLPYVVSFMSLDYQQTGKFLGLIIFLLWMFWITHRSGQLLLNPLFIAFGWRLYEITYQYPGGGKDHHGRALSKDTLMPNSQCLQALVQDVMIVRNTEEAKGRES